MYTLSDLSKYLNAETHSNLDMLDVCVSNSGILRVPEHGYVYDKLMPDSDREVLVQALRIYLVEQCTIDSDEPCVILSVLLKSLSIKVLQLCLGLSATDIEAIAAGARYPYLIHAYDSVFLNYRDKVKTCNIREERAKLNSTLYFILNTSPYKQLRTIYKQSCNDTQDMDTVVRLLHRNHIDVYTLARACYMPVDSIRNIIKGDGTLTNYSRRRLRSVCVGSDYNCLHSSAVVTN